MECDSVERLVSESGSAGNSFAFVRLHSALVLTKGRLAECEWHSELSWRTAFEQSTSDEMNFYFSRTPNFASHGRPLDLCDSNGCVVFAFESFDSIVYVVMAKSLGRSLQRIVRPPPVLM